MKFKLFLQQLNIFALPEYKRSRAFFTLEGAFATILGTLVSGAILAGLLDYVGVPERYNGMVLAIPVFAALLQPFGAYIFEGIRRKKRAFLLILLLHRTLFSLLFLVPVLFSDTRTRILVLVGTYAFSSLLVALPTATASNWIYQLTTDRNRARYLAIRERYMVFLSALFAFFSGFFIDYFKSQNAQTTGYVIVFCIAAFSVFGNCFCIANLNAAPIEKPVDKTRTPLGSSLLLPFRDRNFRPVLAVTILWQISSQIFVPYWGIHQINALRLSYTYLMALAFVAAIMRTLLMPLWVHLSKRMGWAFCTVGMFTLMGLTNILNALIVPQAAYVMNTVTAILCQLPWAAVNLCLLNLQFQYAPEESRTVYLGINAATSGICGFIGVLFAGALMGAANHLQWTLLGAPFKGQQLQMLVAMVVLLAAAGYTFFAFKVRIKRR